MNTLKEMVETIRQRPRMLLGGSSVFLLEAFLAGFAYARKEQQLDDYEVLAGFDRFVHRHFEITSTQGWAKIIAFFSTDEADQMTLFWKLFDKYTEEKNH